MKNKYIGIGYKKQSGKNTVALMLQHYFLNDMSLFKLDLEDWIKHFTPRGYPTSQWKIHSFAAPIKRQVASTWGIQEEQFESEEFKNSKHPHLDNVTWRDLLIAKGEGMRKADPGYWIEAEKQSLMPYNNYIFTDVRRFNEAAFIKANSGILIHVHRPWTERGTDQPEIELDNFNGWDILLENSRDIQYLYKQLTDKLKQWNL